jgi:Sec-independent protein translocase TatC
MTTSFWLAVLLAFPYMMYEVWRFISPALYENEKRMYVGFSFLGPSCFLLVVVLATS